MKTRILLAALLIVGTVFLRGDGCIMKDKPVDLIAYIEIFEEFDEYEITASWADPDTIIFDIEVDEEIKDAGYSRDQVTGAKFVVGHYGALSNDSAHDWIVEGEITVQRLDVPGQPVVTAIAHQSQSVDDAIGKKIKADVEPGAIDVINQAIEDYIDGMTGVELEFRLAIQDARGPANETPSVTDPMDFEWKAWIEFYVKVTEEFEWPDPF
jgi:hypothetical protein